MPIFILLLIVPLVEIAAFIVIGGQIGVATTLLLTLATAIIGTALLRRQGLAIVEQIRREFEANRIPARQMVDAALIAAAGILLLTPGFVTDAVGFALFVPALRDFVWRQLGRRLDIKVRRETSERPQPEIVDLERSEYSGGANPDSPWRNQKM